MSDMTPTVALAKEAERLEEDVLYAEKQHFSMATIWRRLHLCLGVPSAVLAALAGVSAMQAKPVLATTLALSSAVLTAVLTFLDPAKSGSAHHNAGIRYSGLRGKLRRLRELDLANGDLREVRSKLEELATEKSHIMETAPHIGGLAYRLGKASILRAEHKHDVDTHTQS